MIPVPDAGAAQCGADDGARRLALALIAQVQDAARRLHHGSESESVHDFRVALRRLRGCLRAYRPWLQPGRKLTRRLRRIARATNAARDAEVALDWVHRQMPALDPGERAGAIGLARRLEVRRAREHRRVRTRALRRWQRVEPKLRAHLANLEPTAGESFNAASAARVRQHADRLERALGALATDPDGRRAHRARIQAKRLRYLLEPFERGGAAVAKLKILQDTLGSLQDSRVLMQSLRAAAPVLCAAHASERLENTLAGGTAPDSDPLPGLLALGQAAAAQRAQAWPSLQGHGEIAAAARHAAARIAALDRVPPAPHADTNPDRP